MALPIAILNKNILLGLDLRLYFIAVDDIYK